MSEIQLPEQVYGGQFCVVFTNLELGAHMRELGFDEPLGEKDFKRLREVREMARKSAQEVKDWIFLDS